MGQWLARDPRAQSPPSGLPTLWATQPQGRTFERVEEKTLAEMRIYRESRVICAGHTSREPACCHGPSPIPGGQGTAHTQLVTLPRVVPQSHLPGGGQWHQGPGGCRKNTPESGWHQHRTCPPTQAGAGARNEIPTLRQHREEGANQPSAAVQHGDPHPCAHDDRPGGAPGRATALRSQDWLCTPN